ncbi:hypothetical protein AU468_09790 [Alkalispirochaeta sphaeroplastigenens]|uniref:N-acetyltransferase domain-containing protein n=1 Tax=Alkalispirochaeta sphaeroplastigenens TaxID=1187066 RepID=A0A2S4JL50_9SPIO|nr:GNAT family N-acetyltransferase [Alkalispirochaeta sphaeroplastigenens]POR00258.1 hypothetical protein AU468_09790 [Alkalispirochaeta sphaeroplastigenens]
MIQLKESEFSSVDSLLDEVPYNVLLAKAVVNGSARGAIWVDCVSKPQACYVRHQYGMAYLVGYTMDKGFRSALMLYLANHDGERVTPEYLQVYPGCWTDVLDPLVSDGALRLWDRSNFRFVPDVERDAASPASKNCVLRADRSSIETFRGAVIPGNFWKSLDCFLIHGVAYRHCLAKNPEITTALAFSAYRDEFNLELGIETAPKFRGQGYARLACITLIQHCLDAGLTPIWSCRTQNEASYRLAVSLGFREIARHPYYELSSAQNKGGTG